MRSQKLTLLLGSFSLLAVIGCEEKAERFDSAAQTEDKQMKWSERRQFANIVDIATEMGE